MILPIYLYGHPVLRQTAACVDASYPELSTLLENMKETMYESDGIGIAAPQVGVSAKIVLMLRALPTLSPNLPTAKWCLSIPK